MTDKLLWAIEAQKERVTARRLAALRAKWSELDKSRIDTKTTRAVEIAMDFENARVLGYDIITYNESVYPDSLRSLSQPPALLYVRGDSKALRSPMCVTVVGSRDASGYGESVATEFAREMADCGICIVSGGAVGIDASAHRGALMAGGLTVAVAGCGLDVDYPTQNRELFCRIERSGAIISEFAPGTRPSKQIFPFRNRIMAALSSAVVVVEAGYKSGALITAMQASEMGKNVYAVPGPITSSRSSGTNALIRDGVTMALSPQDIIDDILQSGGGGICAAELLEESPAPLPKEAENPVIEARESRQCTELENLILDAIREGHNTVEEIERCCGESTNRLTAVLGMLEMRGIIRLAFGNKYLIQ
ncbi:MAG: DNA-processing protein DprA [Clostridia bacterium]|nr:DNA-processing protein DprA [Clostridia bacterium]